MNRQSHKLIEVKCDLRISNKCKKKWNVPYRRMMDSIERNNGKILCLYCSRKSKFTGRDNPNCKYTFSDDLLTVIDTEDKAYLLGWIASDGTIRKHYVEIAIHAKDTAVLQDLRDIISTELPIKNKSNKLQSLRICSTTLVKDVCKYLDIAPGKKSHTVGFPALSSDLTWAFIRGFFDGDGHIRKCQRAINPYCKITTNSNRFREGLVAFCGNGHDDGENVSWWGNNAIDFLGKLYDNATIYLNRKRNVYLDWSCWVPALSGKNCKGSDLLFKWHKCHELAVPPGKTHASDSGWDLTLIREIKRVDNIVLYGTGIKITPAFGWYFQLVPRSSIWKSGYILANSIGIIDRSYNGEIMVPLIKIDQDKPDITLPARLVQIIPSPIIHFDWQKTDDLPDTLRGAGGFGSTGKR